MKQVLLVVVLFVAAMIAGRFLSGSGELDVTDRAQLELDAVACEPSVAACIAKLPDGSQLRMQILPMDAIVPMKQLQAEVTVSGDWQAVRLEATGLNMNMGLNRFGFQAIGAHAYRADFILPICTLKRMEWQLAVTLTNSNSSVTIPFHFAIES